MWMLYAVCTNCPFLRAFSREGSSLRPPDCCPACGEELIVRGRAGRFPPAYVGRVSLDLMATPELQRSQPRDRRQRGGLL
jgi:predicted RNA-binding Zn-ribbon protein involved in translation (DUF1610 family)